MYTYVIKCPLTKSVKYVGKTKNTDKRFKQHLNCLITKSNYCSNKRLYDWITLLNMYGLSPVFEVVSNKDIEANLIEEYSKNNHLYNSRRSHNRNYNSGVFNLIKKDSLLAKSISVSSKKSNQLN